VAKKKIVSTKTLTPSERDNACPRQQQILPGIIVADPGIHQSNQECRFDGQDHASVDPNDDLALWARILAALLVGVRGIGEREARFRLLLLAAPECRG
jgi:hypothetical protein